MQNAELQCKTQRFLKFFWLFLGLTVTVYLLLPGPKLPPPDLPESLKSTEPGDTIQLKNVSAYFTDKSRQEVLDFYTNYFSHSLFFNIPLLTYRLNHPPEYAREIIRDTTMTYYLEEIVHPLHGSLFVNGFEWENDVFTPKEMRAQNAIKVGGKIWKSKITLRWKPSRVWTRLLVFWAAWSLMGIVLTELKREMEKVNLMRFMGWKKKKRSKEK